jgi:heat shock protein HtpX
VSLAAARNLAKAWLLALIVAAAFGAAGWALGGFRTASIFVFCALLAGLAVYAYADRALLGMLGAREYALAEDPLLDSTVARLAAKAGVVKPKLYVIADGFPRAFSAGRGPRSSALAVSTGLLGALPPAELDAVVAHELAHVRSRDVLVQTFAVSFAVTLVELSRIGGWLERVLLFVLAPVASAFVHLLLSSRRELAADAFAAGLCGTPHGIADALRRLDQAGELVSFQASAATEPLYTINPFEEEGIARMFVTHPPLEERLLRLRELGPTSRPERLDAAS